MRMLLKRVAVSALLLFVSTAAGAQATAQMSGTVRDESGAVLPGVTVTVTQTDTGFTRTVVTGAEIRGGVGAASLGPRSCDLAAPAQRPALISTTYSTRTRF